MKREPDKRGKASLRGRENVVRHDSGSVSERAPTSADRQRQKAEEEMQASRHLFRTLAQVAPVGIFRTDPFGECLYVNERWQEIAGITETDALGSGWTRSIHPDDRGAVFAEWSRCTQNRIPFHMEYRFQRPDGAVTWLQGQALAEIDAHGNVISYVGTITDITARKCVEDKLRTSEAHLKEAQQLTKLGSWHRDYAHDALYWSDEMFRIAEVEPAEFDNSFENYLAIVHPDDRDRFLQGARDAHTARVPYELEYRLKMPDGRVKWVHSRATASYDRDGHPLVMYGTTQDITVQKETETALRRYGQRLIEMEEEVRRMLAAELHDEMGPDLTALNFNLALIRASAKAEQVQPLAELVSDSGQLVDGLSSKVRNIIARLQPTVLFDYGLEAALRWYADLMMKRTGMTVSVVAQGAVPRLPKDHELALFRIAKEALTNAAKHSGAKSVSVSLGCTGSTVRLSVSDDGTGFDQSATPLPDAGGWGLAIMRERTKMLGGTFRLETAPGTGTTICLEIPKECTDAD